MIAKRTRFEVLWPFATRETVDRLIPRRRAIRVIAPLSERSKFAAAPLIRAPVRFVVS